MGKRALWKASTSVRNCWQSGAAGWDGHAGTGIMSAVKLGIKGEISHHLWKVYRIPQQQHLIFEMSRWLNLIPDRSSKHMTFNTET